MIHDIAHCNRKECKRKDTCYRYQAYLELLKTKGITKHQWFLLIENTDECKDFLSLK